jgi:hypothetical protein
VPQLIVAGWEPSKAWVQPDSWSRGNLAERIGACTSLGRTEVKRLVRRVAARETLDFEILDIDRAQPAIHALESMGATIKVV